MGKKHRFTSKNRMLIDDFILIRCKQYDMASFEFLAVVLSVLGLSASITYYAMVLSNANKTRKAQLFMSIYNMTLDEEINKNGMTPWR
jgi:hypothetical protein